MKSSRRFVAIYTIEEAGAATLGRYLLSTLPVYSLATIGKVILVLGADTVGEEAETVDKLPLFPLTKTFHISDLMCSVYLSCLPISCCSRKPSENQSFLFLHCPVHVLSRLKYFSKTLKVSSGDKVVSLGE